MAKNKAFIDYYEVLGIWPTADADAIKKAYFNLAKVHHPDIVGKPHNSDDGVDFKMINEAFGILSDRLKRHEFDETLKKAKGGGTEPEHRDADKRSAQLAFEQARTAMKANRYDKAVVLLKSAIKYDDSNAAYHSWYGFALAKLKTHLHEARDACRKALETEFYNSDFHANLGFVYYQAGLNSTADEAFAEALKWDPDHAMSIKYYGGLAKSGGNDSGGLSGLFSMFKRPKNDSKKAKAKKPGPAKARDRKR